MTTAISEILERAESLSSAERMELASRLMVQTRQIAEVLPHNSRQREAPGVEPPSQPDPEENLSENDEDWLEVFSLKHAPPKASYVINVKFVDGGRGQPRRYDFSDLFDNEEEEEKAV